MYKNHRLSKKESVIYAPHFIDFVILFEEKFQTDNHITIIDLYTNQVVGIIKVYLVKHETWILFFFLFVRGEHFTSFISVSQKLIRSTERKYSHHHTTLEFQKLCHLTTKNYRKHSQKDDSNLYYVVRTLFFFFALNVIKRFITFFRN